MSVSAKHKLVFHGLGDDSAETLRRVKTVLVADLGFSAEQAKDFLEHAPLCIKTAASARDLEVPHSLLEEAGALVMVESPAGSEESSFEASSYDDDYDEDDDSVMIEFDFIDEYQEVTPKPRKKKPVRVYTLEEPEADEKFFDGDSEVNALLSQMSSGTILSKPPETIPVPTPPPPAAPTEKPQTTTVEPQVSAIEPQISAPSSQTTAIEPPEIKAIAPSPTPLKSKSEPKRPPPKIQPVQPSPPKPPALEARKPATAPEPTDLRART
ncbi:MAG: hypothetical protein GX589_07720, partial [Deltaproteobacteria bacterium]|nr:hypothetical protein [Deltaproteobacteria bacterium]